MRRVRAQWASWSRWRTGGPFSMRLICAWVIPSHPARDLLGDAVAAVDARVGRVLAVSARQVADVLGGAGVAELLRVPEPRRRLRRVRAQRGERPLARVTAQRGVVTRKTRATPAVTRRTAGVHAVLTLIGRHPQGGVPRPDRATPPIGGRDRRDRRRECDRDRPAPGRRPDSCTDALRRWQRGSAADLFLFYAREDVCVRLLLPLWQLIPVRNVGRLWAGEVLEDLSDPAESDEAAFLRSIPRQLY